MEYLVCRNYVPRDVYSSELRGYHRKNPIRPERGRLVDREWNGNLSTGLYPWELYTTRCMLFGHRKALEY